MVTLFALFERVALKYRLPVYLSIGIALVLVAGLREVGIDPDSLNYENTYLHYSAQGSNLSVEYSFLFISQILNIFTSDVHALFVVYAALGVGIKLYAIPKLSKLWMLPLMIYISYYFTIHECMQIRTGVLSGMFLLAIKELGDGNKKKALLYLTIGTLFHYSGVALLPVLFLSNKEMNRKQRFFWISLIPIGYALYLGGFSILMNSSINIPYIGEKLSVYQMGTEKGLMNFASVNVFSPIRLLTLLIYGYLFYFQNTISIYNKYFPLLLKIFAIGIFSYVAFAFFPVLGQRLSMLYEIVTLILYANIYYTIRPRWAAIVFVFLMGILYLNYSLFNIGTVLLWEV